MSTEKTALDIFIGEGSVVVKCLSILKKLSLESEIDYEDTDKQEKLIEMNAYQKAFNEVNQAFNPDELNYELKMITEKCEELHDEAYNEGIKDAIDKAQEKE